LEDNNDLKEAEKKFKEAKTKVAYHKEALKIMRKTRGHAETICTHGSRMFSIHTSYPRSHIMVDSWLAMHVGFS
jgi:hypothetical protein